MQAALWAGSAGTPGASFASGPRGWRCARCHAGSCARARLGCLGLSGWPGLGPHPGRWGHRHVRRAPVRVEPEADEGPRGGCPCEGGEAIWWPDAVPPAPVPGHRCEGTVCAAPLGRVPPARDPPALPGRTAAELPGVRQGQQRPGSGPDSPPGTVGLQHGLHHEGPPGAPHEPPVGG